MARPAIFLTLIAATLAGPLLCCCTLARAFSAAPSQTPETTAAVPKHEPACPYCRAAAVGDGVTSSRPSPPVNPSKSCPCCAERAATVAVAPQTIPQPPPEHPLFAILPIQSNVVSAELFGAYRSEFPPGRGIQAFLLDSCHRLRC